MIPMEAKRAKHRHEIFDLYKISVYIVGGEGRQFVSHSLPSAQDQAEMWLDDMKKWAAYFKVTCPEVQWVMYSGSNGGMTEDKCEWEDLRYNYLVVGTGRDVKFNDFKTGFFYDGKVETGQEA